MSETNRQNELESRIGRCTVCEVPANIMNLHSQTDQVGFHFIIINLILISSIQLPSCPSGWKALWIGYSYNHVGQSLGSTGSCLSDYR